MSINMTVTTAVCAAVLGSVSASARENCGSMYQRVMEAYQTQSPRYSPDAQSLQREMPLRFISTVLGR
jgi:hypothetical protein